MQSRAIFVVATLDVGGIETYVLRVLRHVDRKRFAIDVGHEAATPGAYADDVRALGCRLFHLRGKLWLGGYVRRLTAMLKQGEYGAICDFTGDFAGASMLAGQLAGVERRIAFYRSSGISHKPDPLRMFYRRRVRSIVRRYASAILSNSEANLRAFYPAVQPGTGKYHVVPNGISLDEFHPANALQKERAKAALGLDGRLVVGHVGGFKPVKNHLFMLRVFDRFRQGRPDATLLFVGDGEMREDIEGEIRARGLDSCVRLAGCRTDVARFLAAMDMFWFPSRFEGLPNAMIEAQAAGLPVITSDSAGVREHVPESGRKYVLDLASEDVWLKTLAALADNEEDRGRQGRANREHAVRHYALEPRLEQFLAFLESPPKHETHGTR